MRTVSFLIALLTASGLASPVDSGLLEGAPFRPSNVEVEWNVPEGDLPKYVWVYEVTPQNFSGAVVCNAMAVGSFRPKDIVSPSDKKLVEFRDNKQRLTRYLKIAPASGWMSYYDTTGTSDMSGPVESVPNDSQVEKLALDYLFRLGIDRSQIALKPRSRTDVRRSRFTSTGEEKDIEVQARGIMLLRQVDGIPIFGNCSRGGFYIEFGNHATVTQFELVWRNLVPHEMRKTATPDEITARIKEGKAVLSTSRDPSHAKRFKVIALTLYYSGATWDMPQQLMYPLASLNVVANLGDREDAFEVLSPILTTGTNSTFLHK